MEAVKGRVEGMWQSRGEKLEATYKQQTFEKEANQVRNYSMMYIYSNMCMIIWSRDLL